MILMHGLDGLVFRQKSFILVINFLAKSSWSEIMFLLNFFKKQYYINSVMILSSFMSCALQAQPYYKWIDAKGSTHYTLTPPPKGAKKQGKVETYSSHTSAQINTLQTPLSRQNSDLSTPAPSQFQPASNPQNTLPNSESNLKTPTNIATPSTTKPSI